MIEGIPILNSIGSILFFLAKVLLIIAAGIALYKSKSKGALIMLIGAIAMLIADGLRIVLLTYAGTQSAEEVVKYVGINSIISGFTFLLFGMGLLLYVSKWVKTPSNKE